MMDNSYNLNPGVTNYVELAAIVIPEKKIGLREKLRAAWAFLPMPLGLGWEKDPLRDEPVTEDVVSGLSLTDMGSGATRAVKAAWMHSLYKDTVAHRRRGSIMMQLKEAGFPSDLSWPHLAVFGTFLGQGIAAIVYAFIVSRPRESYVIVGGMLVRIFEAIFMARYPLYLPARRVKKQRFYILHTGMTTSHLLVISHNPSSRRGVRDDKPFVNLEDAAVPWPRKSGRRHKRMEQLLRGALTLFRWIWIAYIIFSPAHGYLIPLILCFGTGIMELVSALTDFIPVCSSVTELLTAAGENASLLDAMTAACQATGLVSVGLVESVYPARSTRKARRLSLDSRGLGARSY